MIPQEAAETPETLECATCGGTAQRAVWGATEAACYRCTGCHAGGHVASTEDGTIVRQGGVFQPLANAATREVWQ